LVEAMKLNFEIEKLKIETDRLGGTGMMGAISQGFPVPPR
jgi:hypothetical protein